MRFERNLRVWLGSALVLGMMLGACGDDDPVEPGADSGTADTGTQDSAIQDSGLQDAATDGGETGCDPECVNGTCNELSCDCDSGWTGDACDELNAPTTDGVVLWLDADEEARFGLSTADSKQVVDSWTGSAGTHTPFSLEPLTDDQRPERVTRADGRSVIRFGGTHALTTTDTETNFWGGLSGTDSYTLFAVYSFSAVNQTAFEVRQRATDRGIGLSSGEQFASVSGYNGNPMMNNSDQVLSSEADSATINQLHVVSLTVSPDAMSLRLNGVEVDTAEAAVDPMLSMGIVNLGMAEGGTRRLNGDVAEVILFSNAFRTPVVEKIEEYLVAKWLSEN